MRMESSGDGAVESARCHTADENGNVHGQDNASRIGDHVEGLGQDDADRREERRHDQVLDTNVL